MSTNLLEMNHIKKQFDGLQVLKDVSIHVDARAGTGYRPTDTRPAALPRPAKSPASAGRCSGCGRWRCRDGLSGRLCGTLSAPRGNTADFCHLF